MTTSLCRQKRQWGLSTALYTSIVASTVGLSTVAMGGAIDPVAFVPTSSPIKRVIILIGENRGLDHTYGTYRPKGAGQTIKNLLSQGIVNEDGTPGPNFALAQQYSVGAQSSWYFGAPNGAKTPYNAANVMPQPNTAGAPSAQGTSSPPFVAAMIPTLTVLENDLAPSQEVLLTTGATGLANGVLDIRVPGAGSLSGPYPLQGPALSDDDYTGDTTHRFFQAAQQQDCSMANATASNPSGCLNDLFPFVMHTYSASNQSQGNEMGFLNASRGQASLLTQLADRFTLSDNFHQSFLGGTGANHMMLGTGDAVFWTDGHGNATAPSASLLANPNPKAATVNQYTVDGNFTGCGDTGQPGVAPIVNYLASLSYRPSSNCQQGHYYMINNVNPGYLPNGALANSAGGIPPAPLRTIGDALNAKGISWGYFGGAYKEAVALSNKAVATNPNNPNLLLAAATDPANSIGIAYCQICNPFSYMTSIMGDAAQRAAHIKDTDDLITGIKTNTLPSVSIGKPDGILDGHPESSKIDLFEGYVQNVLAALQSNPRMMAQTVVFITWDEAGGYYDSGYVQPIDFFGDGPRIPLLVLSPYSTGGKVAHAYADHVSLLKFVERNWSVGPVTSRSRDNLPNPIHTDGSPYVPLNSPALDDLFGAFDFSAAPVMQSYLQQ